jgi:hypothetical protein
MIEVKEKTLKLSPDSHRKLKTLSSEKGISLKAYLDITINSLYDEYKGFDTLPLSEEEEEAIKLSEEDIKAGRIQSLDEVIRELEE